MRRVTLVAAAVIVLLVFCGPTAVALSVSVPSSKNLGSFSLGTSSISAQLGTVTAADSGLVAPNLTAQVTCTAFKTGAGTANETIPCSAVSYWSGTATAQSGLSGTMPGQPTAGSAVTLGSSRHAFSATGLLLSVSVSWNPTVTITLPASAVAGSYSGKITHSVA